MTNECIGEQCFCWNFGGKNSCRAKHKNEPPTQCQYPSSGDDEVDGRIHPRDWMVKRDMELYK